MSDFKNSHKALVSRILEGDGRASRALRRGAFDNTGLAEPVRTLISQVAEHPTEATDEEFARVRASGLSEDQIFEMVVSAAIGQATRQYNTALAALDAATERSEHAPRDSR
jgi:alkylhydroperoxidase family enzyme